MHIAHTNKYITNDKTPMGLHHIEKISIFYLDRKSFEKKLRFFWIFILLLLLSKIVIDSYWCHIITLIDKIEFKKT